MNKKELGNVDINKTSVLNDDLNKLVDSISRRVNTYSHINLDNKLDSKTIVKELNNYVKSIDSDFSVELWFKTDLVLVLKDSSIATFNEFDPNNFTIDEMNKDLAPIIAKTIIINKFYKKAYEVLNKRIDKYTVKITKYLENYLHASFCDNYNSVCFKQLHELPSWWVYKFTKQEIESFKKRDDLAIDWNKAIIEKVEE